MNMEHVAVKEMAIDTSEGTLAVSCWNSDVQSDLPPIIMFHDSLGSIALWREMPAKLASMTGLKVIAYDRLGFGRSSVRTDKLSNDFVAREPENVIPVLCKEFDFNNFIALGHSVGGAMTIESAAQFPAQCQAIITIAAQTYAEDVTLNGIREAKVLFSDPKQLERLARYHGERAKWVVDAWIETWLSDAFKDWTLAETLPRVQCPALIFHGSDDEYGSTVHADIIAQKVSGSAQVEIMEGYHHMPHRENEDLVLQGIQNFILEHFPELQNR
ncbi:MAG: alpha/beta hydrolase [Methylocystaceae bacterium]|nr:alpha/beta hydrolase [Methylocystaceae bacterium]